MTKKVKSCLVVNLWLWRTQTHRDIIEFQNFLLQLKNQSSVDKFVFNFSIILVLKEMKNLSKTPCILPDNNIKFNKNKVQSKMGTFTHTFRNPTLFFHS